MLWIVLLAFAVAALALPWRLRARRRAQGALLERLHEALSAASGAGDTELLLDHHPPRLAASGALELSIAAPAAAAALVVTREGWLHALAQRLGRKTEVETGYPSFDRSFFLRTDDPQAYAESLRQDAVRSAISRLMRLGVTRITHAGARLSALLPLGSGAARLNVRQVADAQGQLAAIAQSLPAGAQFPAGGPQPLAAAEGLRLPAQPVGIALLAAGLAATLVSYRRAPIDSVDFFLACLWLIVPLLAVFWYQAERLLGLEELATEDRNSSLGMAFVGITFLVWGGAAAVNHGLDFSLPQAHEVLVESKHITSGKSRRYEVVVESWRPGRNTETLHDRDLYERVEPGETVVSVISRAGFLGYEYIQGAEPR